MKILIGILITLCLLVCIHQAHADTTTINQKGMPVPSASEDSKLKMRNAKLGKPSAMAKPIITDKGIFKSIALACSYHGIQISTYYRRLNKNKTDWVTV